MYIIISNIYVYCRRSGYKQSCDWWSVGVIFYEMIIGRAPFHGDTPSLTQQKANNIFSAIGILYP